MKIDRQLTPEQLEEKVQAFWELSAKKIKAIEKRFDTAKGAPVITANGKYIPVGWTEWTQGFQYGSALLQYDATGNPEFLELGRLNTIRKMTPHLTHSGVHDHGFNNISTYGNLLRLMNEGKIAHGYWEKNYYELALKISGAVQAMRFTKTNDGGGFLYSFNGPHSLFVDTIRSCRVLVISHQLGHLLLGESDERINLLHRAIGHLLTTARYNIFYGEGRDIYDLIPGRTAHEIIFNTKDGNYRCPNSQQGYSGYSTWTRGLAWAMLGFAEELEFFDSVPSSEFEPEINKEDLISLMIRAGKATCDYYINHTTLDGIPFWDTGAPGLSKLGDYKNKVSDPYNEFEPVDSSAAVIGAQGLLRLGSYLKSKGDPEAELYSSAGLTVANTLLEDPYLSVSEDHEGIILHSIYHRPNGWDTIPDGKKVPSNESSMWGDYHARELMLYLQRRISKGQDLNFFTLGAMNKI